MFVGKHRPPRRYRFTVLSLFAAALVAGTLFAYSNEPVRPAGRPQQPADEMYIEVGPEVVQPEPGEEQPHVNRPYVVVREQERVPPMPTIAVTVSPAPIPVWTPVSPSTSPTPSSTAANTPRGKRDCPHAPHPPPCGHRKADRR